jgi:hypothetical protein
MTTPCDGGNTKNQINSYYEDGSFSGNIVTFTNEYNPTHGGATPSILAPAYRVEFGASLHVRASSVAINGDGLTFNSSYRFDPTKSLVDFEYGSADSETNEKNTGQEGAQGRAIFYTNDVATRQNMSRSHEFGRDRNIYIEGCNNTISNIYQHSTTSDDILFGTGIISGSAAKIKSPAVNDVAYKVVTVDLP